MARSKNANKRRQQRKRKKELKRKAKKYNPDRPVVARPLPFVDDFDDFDDLDDLHDGDGSLQSIFAEIIGGGTGSRPPDWACHTSWFAGFASHASGRPAPSREAPPPHQAAKLGVLMGVDIPWGLVDVRGRSTEELVEALARCGATVDPATFAERARGRRSAWRLGDDLATREADPIDLPGAVATELWRRWLPDTPCYESICDTIQCAYPLYFDDPTGTKVTPHWMKAWRDLTSLLPAEITSFSDMARETGMLELPRAWVGAMWDGVMNVAREDHEFVSEALAFVRWVRSFDDPPPEATEADEAELVAIAEGVESLAQRDT
jgi:hypothetical protein